GLNRDGHRTPLTQCSDEFAASRRRCDHPIVVSHAGQGLEIRPGNLWLRGCRVKCGLKCRCSVRRWLGGLGAWLRFLRRGKASAGFEHLAKETAPDRAEFELNQQLFELVLVR